MDIADEHLNPEIVAFTKSSSWVSSNFISKLLNPFMEALVQLVNNKAKAKIHTAKNFFNSPPLFINITKNSALDLIANRIFYKIIILH